VSSAGVEADGGQGDGSICADGTSVVFASDATNLVAGDTNNARDVFKHVLATSTTTRVSTAADGSQASDGSTNDETGINSDGQFVVFRSSATNLVPGDTNSRIDAFRKDTTTGEIIRVSVSTAGAEGDATGAGPFISANGNLVGFESDATNMVADDTNGERDIFVRNVALGTTVILSRPQDGSQANAASLTDTGQGLAGACFTGDGLGVFFRSNASNLVNGDTNGFVDFFYRLLP
jgi:Tol biopolymer transport system component